MRSEMQGQNNPNYIQNLGRRRLLLYAGRGVLASMGAAVVVDGFITKVLPDAAKLLGNIHLPTAPSLNLNGSTSSDISKVPEGTTLLTYHGHKGVINAISWSPDGKSIASSNQGSVDNGNIQVWDSNSGQEITSFTNISISVPTGSSYSCWSPDGKYLAAGAELSFLEIWDAATFEQKVEFDGGNDWYVYGYSSFAWSPDSKNIAIPANVDGLALWEATTGKFVRGLNYNPFPNLTFRLN
jgi:WD40 repeat protein